MVSAVRQWFNQNFSDAKYAALLQSIEAACPGQLEFRVAETPVFVPNDFKQKMLDACDHILDVICSDAYRAQSRRAIPPQLPLTEADDHPHCIAFDFGVCQSPDGGLEPQLIELQGFPSLFAFDILLPELSNAQFHFPQPYTPYLSGLDKDSYIELFKKLVLADSAPENVVLLEIFPEQQKTRIDFFCTEMYLGIKTVCLTKLVQEGRSLFYDNNGVKTKINRIYNRVIFDDLAQQPAPVQEKGHIFFEDLDVNWVPHPAWFYRISKFTLPFLNHPFVPPTQFLSDVKTLPADLQNYVLKPLFSFAGQGVVIDVTAADVDAITDRENWILQRKVPYANAVQTPGEPAKAEIRLFYFWEPGAARPVAANNLARLSKGKMIGVRYNKDKSWVGGTFALFEP